MVAVELADFQDDLAERGIDPKATLPFTVIFTPGGDDGVSVKTQPIPVSGSEDHVKEPALRRPLVKEYTLTSADVAREIDAKGFDARAERPTADEESRRA